MIKKKTPNRTLLELIKQHNDGIQKRIGVNYTFSTFQKYDILFKKIEAFISYQYGRTDMLLNQVGYAFAVEFDFYLRKKDKNKHNTVVKYIINLKAVFNQAVILGYIEKNPIIAFKATYKDVDRVYLTFSELKKIEESQLNSARLKRTRDLFLFQCYTGLAYSDMMLLTEKSIFLGVDDKPWIFIRRKKTDVRCAIPLLPKALAILNSYKSENEIKVLPCYAIQKFNKYLQEIGKGCAINKNLTSHVGRRTFATTIALTNGVSIETVSKILGHSSTRITQQYSVVTDLKISLEMKKLNDILEVIK